jgi:hypothetical protein
MSMMVMAASLSLIILFAARLSFFLFRTATSHALAGACSQEVDDGCFGRYCRCFWTKLGVVPVTNLPTQRRV